MKIIVVDDDEGNRTFVSEILRDRGHQVISVTNGAEAWALISNGQKFDAVISDMHMPKMTGLELLERIDPSTLKFVLMSGETIVSEADPRMLEDICIQMGVKFLKKPWAVKDLLSAIED